MFTLNCKGKLLVLDEPKVMGIINVTPDSFFEGSRSVHIDSIVAKAGAMLKDGAAIIDIGGQSTRPGSERVDAYSEMTRVLDPIAAIHQQFPDCIISIDTYYSEVAAAAIDAGASIVNDVTGGEGDAAMIGTVADANVPFVLMHMKGTLSDMQSHAVYNDVTSEVLDYFICKLSQLKKSGIKDIIIDPGFGFAKTIEHNFKLLSELDSFRILDCPVLVGLSRKATVYKTLGSGPEDALNGTTVLNTVALMKNAAILRVHDVKEAVEAIKLTRLL